VLVKLGQTAEILLLLCRSKGDPMDAVTDHDATDSAQYIRASPSILLRLGSKTVLVDMHHRRSLLRVQSGPDIPCEP